MLSLADRYCINAIAVVIHSSILNTSAQIVSRSPNDTCLLQSLLIVRDLAIRLPGPSETVFMLRDLRPSPIWELSIYLTDAAGVIHSYKTRIRS